MRYNTCVLTVSARLGTRARTNVLEAHGLELAIVPAGQPVEAGLDDDRGGHDEHKHEAHHADVLQLRGGARAQSEQLPGCSGKDKTSLALLRHVLRSTSDVSWRALGFCA